MFSLFALILLISFSLIGRAQNEFFKQFESMLGSIQNVHHTGGLGSTIRMNSGPIHGPLAGMGISQLPTGFSLLSSDMISKDFVDEVSEFNMK